MSRIGQFLLHDGCWNGEQILDPAYLHEAEKNQYPVNAPKHGYGYFFWTNPDDESYRADGRYGQYIVVVPKSNVVVTVQALDSKKFFDDVWSELVVPFSEQGLSVKNNRSKGDNGKSAEAESDPAGAVQLSGTADRTGEL